MSAARMAIKYGPGIYRGYQRARTGARVAGRLARVAAPVAVVAGRAYKSMVSRSRSAKIVMKKHPKAQPGKYAGKFKRGKKLSNRVDKFVNSGFTSTTEVNGIITDPDICYIGVSSTSGIQAMELVLQAVLRKAIEKTMNWNVTNMSEVLQGYAAAAGWLGDGLRLQLIVQANDTGIQTVFDYDTVPTDSIYAIVGDVAQGVAGTWTALLTETLNIARGNVSDNTINSRQIIRLNVFRRDGNVGIFYVGSGGLDMTNEYVHYRTSSEIKIQNRSVAANASTDATNVANNPVQGYIYSCKGGVPLVQNPSTVSGGFLLDQIKDNNGVMLVRGAEFTNTAGLIYREPQGPRFFKNCSSLAKVMIDPGQIKVASIKWKKSLRFNEMLRLIGDSASTLANRATQRLPGVCKLFALEDMINVNALEVISIAYEVNRKSGCYISSGKHKPALGRFYQLTYNNP